MKKLPNLSHERLKEVLDFDPVTGFLTWKVSPSNSVRIGERAGALHRNGGRYIAIDGEKFLGHRLAWFYAKGEWPEHDVRAINGDFDDCRIENLKDVPRVEITHLRNAPSTNTSGFIGVSRSRLPGKWQASITWNYKQIALGRSFETPEDASEIYQEALAILKQTTTPQEVELALKKIKLLRRQRAVWKNLQRHNTPNVWASFEDFAKDILDIPAQRHGMVPEDVSLPIGPDNYRWSMPGSIGMSAANPLEYAKEYSRLHRKNNKDHYRAKHLRKEYGADIAYERKMLVEQNGVCAICEKPEELTRNSKTTRKLSLDHDHATGALRGLLCGNCNLAVGYFCDDPVIMQKAIAYLDRYKLGGVNIVKFKKGEE